MSLSYTIDVHCDRCGNWISGVTVDKPQGNVRKALAVARRAGWSRDTKSLYTDVCPACLKEEQTNPTGR